MAKAATEKKQATEVAMKVITTKADISDLEQQLKLYTSQKELLEDAQNPSSVSEEIKRAYNLKLNEMLQSLNEKNISLTKQLKAIKNNVENSSVTASSNGVIMYFEENMLGKTLSAGTEIGVISTEKENYMVEIYIPEYEILNFSVGKKIEYVFPSLSMNQYGKTYGEITYISTDSFINQSKSSNITKLKAPCLKQS